MTARNALRGAVAAFLALLLWLGWQGVRPPERVGDVPYVATRPPVVDRMLELAGIGPDDLLFDLGSGDGRIVLRAAARFGARARGYELDRLLVAESRAAAARAGLDHRVEFVEGDLFDAPLHEATAVTLFLLPTVNRALRPRLLAELAPGTPVVSHMWDMAEWQPDVHEVVALDPPADVYCWVVPAGFGGRWSLSPVGAEASRAPSPDALVLTLQQRFQEIEGELSHGGRSTPVSGTAEGVDLRLESTRPHALLGRVTVHATIEAGRLRGELVAAGDRTAIAGARRVPDLGGPWRMGIGHDPFTPQWSMRWQRGAARWTVTRWRADTDAPAPSGPRLPGAWPPLRDATQNGEPVGEIYVWGASILFAVDAGDGSGRRILYQGLVEDDRIAGFAHDGGALVPWIAVREADAR
jgi:hypothetical protein